MKKEPSILWWISMMMVLLSYLSMFLTELGIIAVPFDVSFAVAIVGAVLGFIWFFILMLSLPIKY